MTLSGGQHICKKVGGRNKKRVSSKTITKIYVNIANAIFLETVDNVEHVAICCTFCLVPILWVFKAYYIFSHIVAILS